MSNKIQLHQIFYGHDGTQYRVLGSTIPELSSWFEELCEKIGTPDRPGVIAPFLMSVPHDGKIIMVQVKSGRNDSVGRKTIFFHAFVVEKSKVNSYKFNAFSLQEQGLFTGSVPVDLKPLEVDYDFVISKSSPVPSLDWDGQTLAVIAAEPNGLVIRSRLCERVNDVAWSTFSFQVLGSPFKLFVLSDRAPRPQNLRCCDPQGKQCNVQSRTFATEQVDPKEKPQPCRSAGKFNGNKVLLVLLALSILLNALLLVNRPTKEFVDKPVPQEPVLTDALRKDARLELRQRFQGEKIENWETVKKMKSFQSFVKQYEKDNSGKQLNLNGYINFVNTEILSDTKGTNP